MHWLDKSLESFGTEQEFVTNCRQLRNAHMPYVAENKKEFMDHFKVS